VYGDAATNFRGMGLAAVPAGEDGRFRIKLPPGSYYLLARKRRGGGMYGPPGRDDYIGYYPGNPVTVRPGVFSPLLLEVTTRVDTLEEIWFRRGAPGGRGRRRGRGEAAPVFTCFNRRGYVQMPASSPVRRTPRALRCPGEGRNY
jgi:hypothetical protein